MNSDSVREAFEKRHPIGEDIKYSNGRYWPATAQARNDRRVLTRIDDRNRELVIWQAATASMQEEIEVLRKIEKLRNMEVNTLQEDKIELHDLIREYVSDIQQLQAEVEALKAGQRELIENAHMTGQNDAGVDPGYSNAQAYANEILEPPKTQEAT
jgi:peptidoglycan hydrolase CwlO-like protein